MRALILCHSWGTVYNTSEPQRFGSDMKLNTQIQHIMAHFTHKSHCREVLQYRIEKRVESYSHAKQLKIKVSAYALIIVIQLYLYFFYKSLLHTGVIELYRCICMCVHMNVQPHTYISIHAYQHGRPTCTHSYIDYVNSCFGQFSGFGLIWSFLHAQTFLGICDLVIFDSTINKLIIQYAVCINDNKDVNIKPPCIEN